MHFRAIHGSKWWICSAVMNAGNVGRSYWVENTTIDVNTVPSNSSMHCFLNVAVIIAPRNDFYFYFFYFFISFFFFCSFPEPLFWDIMFQPRYICKGTITASWGSQSVKDVLVLIIKMSSFSRSAQVPTRSQLNRSYNYKFNLRTGSFFRWMAFLDKNRMYQSVSLEFVRQRRPICPLFWNILL